MGSDAITNRGAVENLMTMGPNEYVYFGKKSGLAKHLGATVHVLGPPTLAQTDTIRSQRQKDADEFWKVLGLSAGAATKSAGRAKAKRGASSAETSDDGEPLQSPFPLSEHLAVVPPAARWFTRRTTRLRRDQLLQIVRVLDDALNNTSLILLLQIGTLSLLFPGDAQIENWEYALKSPEHSQRVQRLLADVSLYKVGHHGSTNATLPPSGPSSRTATPPPPPAASPPSSPPCLANTTASPKPNSSPP